MNIEFPSRAKYWEEMTPDQKIERLGDWIDICHRRIKNLERIVTLLNQHSHTQEGKIVVPLVRNEPEYPAAWPNENPLNRGQNDK
jgi:hypothetical protein